MKRICTFLLFSLFISLSAHAFPGNKKVTSVPFEMAGSYVVIKTTINDSSPLNMILDTGVKNTIINELMEDDELNLNKSITDSTRIQGLGNNQGIKAYRSYKNEVKIGKIKFTNKAVLLLPENIFNFTNYTGKKINGILGSDVLRDYIVEINYTKSRVIFYNNNNNTFNVPSGYSSIPAVVSNNKLYITAGYTGIDSVPHSLRMLVDTGAELGSWLFNKSISSMPDKKVYGYIGEGLSGEIKGYYARSVSLCLGPHCISNPIVTFPDSAFTKGLEQETPRDGTLGNQTLKRFNCIIDFKTPAFYLKRNFMFKNKFRYNVAGIEVLREMPHFFITRVHKIWENSPADIKGVREGDLILEVNGMKTFQMNVSEIRDVFETSRRFPLHIVIQRDSEVIDLDLNMNSKI